MTKTDPPWDGDINEAVIEEWTSETTPFERVREILLSTTTTQYAREIAERACVSEPTARKHLELLADSGIAETAETGRGRQYKRSRQVVAMQRIGDLHAELSREELTEGIKDFQRRIQTCQEEYEATSPDDLALGLDSGDADEWAIVSEWRALTESLDLAQAALALYDFTPDQGGDGGDRTLDGRVGTRGAFAHERDAFEVSS